MIFDEYQDISGQVDEYQDISGHLVAYHIIFPVFNIEYVVRSHQKPYVIYSMITRVLSQDIICKTSNISTICTHTHSIHMSQELDTSPACRFLHINIDRGIKWDYNHGQIF